jgi:hypothetical protein
LKTSLLLVRISLPLTFPKVPFCHVTGNIPVSLMTCSPGGNPLIYVSQATIFLG